MKMFRILLPGLGLLLLGFLVGTLGLVEILQNLAVMGWSFFLVLLLAFGWHVTNSIAWSFAFPADAFHTCLLMAFPSPPCRWFGSLLMASVYSLPSSVNLPLAMRLQTRPVVQPKYWLPSPSYPLTSPKPFTTSAKLPFLSGTCISTSVAP